MNKEKLKVLNKKVKKLKNTSNEKVPEVMEEN